MLSKHFEKIPRPQKTTIFSGTQVTIYACHQKSIPAFEAWCLITAAFRLVCGRSVVGPWTEVLQICMPGHWICMDLDGFVCIYMDLYGFVLTFIDVY